MKLTEFSPFVETKKGKLNKVGWDLAFVIGVFAIIATCFVYDAQQEQASQPNKSIISSN